MARIPPIEYFPPRPRKDGRWAKWIMGKQYTWTGTRDEALAQYRRVAPALYAGQQVVSTGEMTVAEVARLYVVERHADAAADRISARHAADIEGACGAFAARHRGRMASSLGPSDFSAWARAWSSRAASTQNRVRAIILAMLRHATAHGWIDRMPAIGTWRTVRAKQIAFELEPARVAKIIEHAKGCIRAFILLGINCGFGPADCAGLDAEFVRCDRIEYPRQKTGILRVCPLWPETSSAVDAIRLPPRTRHGNPWNASAIGHEWRDCCDAAGVTGHGFYSLRHCFATLARDCRDDDAYRRIMGRVVGRGADRAYIHDVPLDRLKAVTDYVRGRVLGSQTSRPRRRRQRGSAADPAFVAGV